MTEIAVAYNGGGLDTCQEPENNSSDCSWSAVSVLHPFSRAIWDTCVGMMACGIRADTLMDSRHQPCGKKRSPYRNMARVGYRCVTEILISSLPAVKLSNEGDKNVKEGKATPNGFENTTSEKPSLGYPKLPGNEERLFSTLTTDENEHFSREKTTDNGLTTPNYDKIGNVTSDHVTETDHEKQTSTSKKIIPEGDHVAISSEETTTASSDHNVTSPSRNQSKANDNDDPAKAEIGRQRAEDEERLVKYLTMVIVLAILLGIALVAIAILVLVFLRWRRHIYRVREVQHGGSTRF